MTKIKKSTIPVDDTDGNFENEFTNIDDQDLSKSGDEPEFGKLSTAETKEGDQLAAPVKIRERRKMPSIEELRQATRMLSYEDRAAVVMVIREDMRNDIDAEQVEEEKAADEKRQKLERLNALKGGL